MSTKEGSNSAAASPPDQGSHSFGSAMALRVCHTVSAGSATTMQGMGPLGRLMRVHGSHPPWPRVPFRPPERKVDLLDIALVVVPVLVVIVAFLLASTL